MTLSGQEPRINTTGYLTGLEPMLHQDKNIVANSIVRGDNHFIRINGKWILIDGSWLDTLNTQYSFHVEEIVYSSPRLQPTVQDQDGYYPISIIHVSWKRVVWYRHYVHYTDVVKPYEWPWTKAWKANWKPGWVCNGGVLPCHLRCVDYDEQLLDLEDARENNIRDRIRRAGLHRR